MKDEKERGEETIQVDNPLLSSSPFSPSPSPSPSPSLPATSLPSKTMSDLLRELANLQIEEPLLTSTASLLAAQGIDVELLQNGEVSGEEMKELGIGIGVVKKLMRLRKA